MNVENCSCNKNIEKFHVTVDYYFSQAVSESGSRICGVSAAGGALHDHQRCIHPYPSSKGIGAQWTRRNHCVSHLALHSLQGQVRAIDVSFVQN